jgi:hypothetical protein
MSGSLARVLSSGELDGVGCAVVLGLAVMAFSRSEIDHPDASLYPDRMDPGISRGLNPVLCVEVALAYRTCPRLWLL